MKQDKKDFEDLMRQILGTPKLPYLLEDSLFRDTDEHVVCALYASEANEYGVVNTQELNTQRGAQKAFNKRSLIVHPDKRKSVMADMRN